MIFFVTWMKLQLLIDTWERHWVSFWWRGPTRDTVGWSRWTTGPRTLQYIAYYIMYIIYIVHILFFLLYTVMMILMVVLPLRAVCSSREPGGPLGFPLRDLPHNILFFIFSSTLPLHYFGHLDFPPSSIPTICTICTILQYCKYYCKQHFGLCRTCPRWELWNHLGGWSPCSTVGNLQLYI